VCLAALTGIPALAAPSAAQTAPATSRAATTPAKLPLAAPPAESFRAYDRPSDDGSVIIVEWAKPPKEVKGALYVVELARRREDFDAGDFKTQTVRPSKGTLKSARQKYFGSSTENRKFYFAEVCPAKLLPAKEPFRLTAERVKEFLKEGVLTDEQARRAAAILQGQKPEGELSAQEKADRQWLEDLESTLSRREALGQHVKEGLLSAKDFDRAAKALANAKGETELTDEEKAERAWLRELETYLPRRQRLEKSLEAGILTPKHFRRAMEALEIRKSDDKLTGEEKPARRWLTRLETYLMEQEQAAEEDRRAEVNSGTYYFRLAVTRGAGDGKETLYVMRDGVPLILTASARPDYFKFFKLNNLIFALAFSGIVMGFIQVARRNPSLFIRKIGGLEAVEEAIGRAAEMGRSVYFVHGLDGIGSLATIAALNILARVARRAAEYDTRVRVMNCDPIVTAVSQGVVQQAYTEAGRPDAYNADDVSLVASDQFSYVAAVSGMMVREQPAAVFLLGYFYAESLLLAETGAATGAIQVAGTDAYTQLPFFVTTCDYTLIGEELYAASAYLSREPRMLGSLRGQDVGKAFLILTMIGVAAALTVGMGLGWDLSWLRDVFQAY
jgi:hypothetical protein